jgi:hypothetical protein
VKFPPPTSIGGKAKEIPSCPCWLQPTVFFFNIRSVKKGVSDSFAAPPLKLPFLGLWVELDDDCSTHPLSPCRTLLLAICNLRCDVRPQSYVSPNEVEIGRKSGELLGAVNFDHFASPQLPPRRVDHPQQRFRMLESVGDGPGVMQIVR